MERTNRTQELERAIPVKKKSRFSLANKMRTKKLDSNDDSDSKENNIKGRLTARYNNISRAKSS